MRNCVSRRDPPRVAQSVMRWLGVTDSPPVFKSTFEGVDWARRRAITTAIQNDRRKRACVAYGSIAGSSLPRGVVESAPDMERGSPAVFDGVTFRSTIEARWATFFKSLGLQYEYESGKYDVGLDQQYIPDFWLPDLKCFIEIKHHGSGGPPTSRECVCARRLAVKTKCWVFVFFGPMSKVSQFSKGSAYAFAPVDDRRTRMQYWWARCPACGCIDLTERGTTRGMRCRCARPAGDVETHNDLWVLDRIKRAAASTFAVS